jgi:hypothetical protein
MWLYTRLWASGIGLVALLACGSEPGSRGAEADRTLAAPPPPLAYLRTFVGHHPGDEQLWETEPLRTRMTRLLGGDYGLFRANLAIDQPLAEEAGLLYIIGTCPASATVWGAALVVIDPEGDRLVLKLRSDRDQQTRTWAEGEIPVLPGEVVRTLASWDERRPTRGKPAPAREPEETKG